MKNILYLFLLAAVVSSCRKNNDVIAPVPAAPAAATPPGQVSYDDLVKDSALLHAKDLYLWYKNIPATMDARQYADPSAIMSAIRPYSMEPGYSQPVDRWSFAVKQSEWDNLGTGNENDLGFSVFFNTANDLRVKYVERESAAGRAGIQRGWQLTAINGNSNIDTSAASIQMIIASVFNSNSGTFRFKRPDGSTINLNLTATAYNEHPVFFDQVYTVNNRKVGYMVFNSFMGDTVDIYNEFSRVFTKFAQNNVNELVIDLRYNGGGYVSVAEKLANYLAPASANGQTMMIQTFNDKYTHYNETIKFHKLGSTNVSRIFFIVSNNTASASELVINSVKPFVDVKLVGPTATTHGKPVGFFPVPAGSWYVFPVSFKTVNKNGEGNYYNGFPIPTRARDGVDANWGDVNESCLAATLDYIYGNVGRSSAQPINNIQKNNDLSKEFKGVIDTRGLR